MSLWAKLFWERNHSERSTRTSSLSFRAKIDFIANAGGVICASVEYHGGSESDAFEQIAQKIRHNSMAVLTRSREQRIEPRQAAVALARERVLEAMQYRN